MLAFLAGLALASRAMRPVASLTAAAREANTQDPSRKLPAPTADDEVGELTETWASSVVTALFRRAGELRGFGKLVPDSSKRCGSTI